MHSDESTRTRLYFLQTCMYTNRHKKKQKQNEKAFSHPRRFCLPQPLFDLHIYSLVYIVTDTKRYARVGSSGIEYH
jgi:hypothetical protein